MATPSDDRSDVEPTVAPAPTPTNNNDDALPRTAINVARVAASDSSDDGVQMTPAAARRFARRNLRRTSATPDLVTSLVRPASPEAFYMHPDVPGRMRQDALARAGQQWQALGTRGPYASSDVRSGPLLPPHASSLDIPERYGGNSIFDMYSLTYVAETDPNLLCPICHDPLVDPVTTPCDHTFCYRCIRRSISSSPSGTACPIDRERLSWPDCFSAARLIRTQLNALTVKCPYRSRGCNKELRREGVERHATTDCRFRQYNCPGSSCDRKLAYKPADDECPHREINCQHCEAAIEEVDRELHLLSCSKAKTRCEACWQLVRRSRVASHHELDCDGVEVACKYQDVGCPVRVMRGELGSHAFSCAFHPETASGAVIRTQRELIQSYGDVGSQLREMQARHDEAMRRIDELPKSNARRTAGDSTMSDNRTMQDLDAGFEEVHQNLTHLEARQSMWTMNQVMPIREEVTELRNNINMVRMHVNWLLNRSREEGRIRAANNTGTVTGIRRDSSVEGPSMLPERRRSSSTDIDIPRL